MESTTCYLYFRKRTGVGAAVQTCLDEFIKGDGVVSVSVSLLDGPVSDAAQLLVRDVHSHHHP